MCWLDRRVVLYGVLLARDGDLVTACWVVTAGQRATSYTASLPSSYIVDGEALLLAFNELDGIPLREEHWTRSIGRIGMSRCPSHICISFRRMQLLTSCLGGDWRDSRRRWIWWGPFFDCLRHGDPAPAPPCMKRRQGLFAEHGISHFPESFTFSS